jgi:hypothetical protein
MMMIKNLCLTFFVLLMVKSAHAQEDLSSMLEDSVHTSEKVLATFKTTRIVNAHSLETVKKKHLDFRVTHRFGDIAGGSGGIHSLYGLDNASNIRIAFEYGLTDNFTLGFGRSKIQEALDGFVKYRLISQTTDHKIPFAITLLASAVFTPQQNTNGNYDKNIYRFSYAYQAIIGKKINNMLSFQLMPSMVHRNYISEASDKNDLFSLGAGGRIKLTKRFALLADYFYTFSNYRTNNDVYFLPLGIGAEIETGGHVFHLFFTNASGIVETHFIPDTGDSWNKGEFKFGFNISRTFGFNKHAVNKRG